MKHGLVTVDVIMILKDRATFQVGPTICSFSILCLEHHYFGDQQWRLLTYQLKQPSGLLPVVLILLLRQSWSLCCYFGLGLGLKNLVLFTSLARCYRYSVTLCIGKSVNHVSVPHLLVFVLFVTICSRKDPSTPRSVVVSVMCSETVDLRTRPVSDQNKIGFGLVLVRGGLGLSLGLAHCGLCLGLGLAVL